MKTKKFISLCILLLPLAGCSFHTDVKHTTLFTPPADFSATSHSTSTQVLSEKWWQDFHDPELNSLIEYALDHNFSLQSAYNRLQQAEAYYGTQRARLFPSISGNGNAAQNYNRVQDTTQDSHNLNLGLSASYELDLWGRVSALSESARLDLMASELDLQTAAISLSAEVANTWYSLVAERAQLAIIDQQIKANTEAAQLINLQFRTGKVPIADLLQQEQVLESSRAEYTQAEAQVKTSFFRLNTLLGLAPADTRIIPQTTTLQTPPELPAHGLPISIIQERPDLKAALMRIKANDQSLAAAIAEQYPKISLQASGSTGGVSSSALFHDWLANLSAGLTAPIFDGGRIASNIDQQEALLIESINNYNNSALNALYDIETALNYEKSRQTYLAQKKRQYELATEAMAQIKNRYIKGVENYQRVLSALLSAQSLERSLTDAQLDILSNRIELCRNLARGWEIKAQLFEQNKSLENTIYEHKE